MRFGCEAYLYLHSDNLFSYFLEKGPFSFRALFPARPQLFASRKRVANGSLRIALPGMRTKLGKPAPLDLRRVFLSSRNHLRLRRDPGFDCSGNVWPRANFATASQHVALHRVAAAAGGL